MHRSPIADPKAKGVVFGLTLDPSEQQLARLYLATVQAIAYGTRHIVEHCNANGHKARYAPLLLFLSFFFILFFIFLYTNIKQKELYNNNSF